MDTKVLDEEGVKHLLQRLTKSSINIDGYKIIVIDDQNNLPEAAQMIPNTLYATVEEVI